MKNSKKKWLNSTRQRITAEGVKSPDPDAQRPASEQTLTSRVEKKKEKK